MSPPASVVLTAESSQVLSWIPVVLLAHWARSIMCERTWVSLAHIVLAPYDVVPATGIGIMPALTQASWASLILW